MIAANSASSSSYEVRINALIDGSTERISRHTSMPLPSGSRPQRRDAVRGVDRRTGLADDLDVVLLLEHVAQATTHHLVVVEQVDPDHVSSCTARGRMSESGAPPARTNQAL